MPRTISALMCAAMMGGVPVAAFADHVTLKNGDALTGRISSSSATEIVLETDLIGRVTIAMTSVSDVQRAGATTATAENAASWHGSVNAAVDVSRGNAETSSVSTNGLVTRFGPRDRLGLFGTTLFSSIGSGDAAVTTARAARGGARYDHDLARALFGFGFSDLEHDALELLDLRTVAGGGLGVHMVKTTTTQFNVFGGVSFAHDQYAVVTTTPTPPATTTTPTPPTTPTTPGQSGSTPGRSGNAPGRSGATPSRGGTPPAVVRTESTRSVGEYLFGQDTSHAFSDAVLLDERFTLFPAVNDSNDYRVSFDLSLTARLNQWLQWNVALADRYLHIPPAGGAVQNDTSVSTGLGIVFGNGSGGGYTGADGRRPATPRR